MLSNLYSIKFSNLFNFFIWLKEESKGCDKILFNSREGYFFKMIANMFKKEFTYKSVCEFMNKCLEIDYDNYLIYRIPKILLKGCPIIPIK